MPSQPFSASLCQNASVTAASLAIMSRTNLVGHSLSRNLRAVSRSNSCSSVKPISIGVSAVSERHRALDNAAVHDAPVFSERGIDDQAVQQTTVVPHDEIAGMPAMPIDEWWLCRVYDQLVEQCPTLRLRQAADVRRMVAEVERLAAGLRMRSNERMINRRAAVIESRAEDDSQAGDPLLHRFGQRLVGERGVGEFGVTAFWWHLHRAQHRQHRWRGVIRLVCMPMVIGGFRGAEHRIAIGVEVRHDMRDIVALGLAAMRAVHLDLAEMGGECKLLLAGQEVAREKDDVMREKGAPDRALHFGR